MKGMSWESPRGPIAIDPATRDIVQDVYIRRVERVDGELYNVEFEKYEAVKNPIADTKAKRVCPSGYSKMFDDVCIDDKTGDIVSSIDPANQTTSK
jgi:hypothetical protein